MELIAGEAVVTPPAGGWASSVQGELFFALRAWEQSGGGVFLQDVVVRMPSGSFLVPDIAWWPTADIAINLGAIEVVPSLVVEVLSPSTRDNDLGAKRDEYAAAGVREIWLADPQAAEVIVISTGHAERRFGRTDRLSSPLLANLVVDVRAVFRHR